MTTHLTKPEQEALVTLALMAAFADGGKSDVERAEVKRITENLDGGDLNTSALYQRVLLRQATIAGGRSLSALQLKELFTSLTDQARSLHGRYAGEIQQRASKLNPAQLLNLARGQQPGNFPP